MGNAPRDNSRGSENNQAQKIMGKAIELRSGIYPNETPFPYKYIK